MITWTRFTNGTGSKAILGNGLALEVYLENATRLREGEPAWNVFVLGNRLSVRSPTQEEAQMRAVALARKWMNEALAKLS